MLAKFQRIALSGWRQFQSVDVVLHDRLTILTGSNGSGKSTILTILRSHFPNEEDVKFLATPIRSGSTTEFSLGDWFASELFKLFGLKKPEPKPTPVIGLVEYTDSTQTDLSLPHAPQMQYALARNTNKTLEGIYIGSHRIPPKYESVTHLPVNGITPAEALTDYLMTRKSFEEMQNYHRAGIYRRVTPLASIKETLISFVAFGIGNAHMSSVPELEGLFVDFQKVLGTVLPKEIGFQSIEIRPPEVVIVSASGSFPIDGASGGLMSIIHIAWQLFLAQKSKGQGFVAIIDEIENHLHPSMQRIILSNLIDAFPDAQFVVATHSPFVISSVRDSYVYALVPEVADGRSITSPAPRSIVSKKLDNFHKAGPASEILRDVLGVTVTMPEWSADELNRIADEFSEADLNIDNLQKLRSQLESAGLQEFYPDALKRIIQ